MKAGLSLKNINTAWIFFSLTADMDPAQSTVEDLMQRIHHNEGLEQSRDVCLFTQDGMPLTDDPFFNTCKFV